MPDFDLKKGTLSAVVNMQNLAFHNSSTNTDIKDDITFKIEMNPKSGISLDNTALDSVYIYLPEALATLLGSSSVAVAYESSLNRVKIEAWEPR